MSGTLKPDRSFFDKKEDVVNERDITRAISPLRMIFWGGLLCIFDITVNLDGFRFDFLNDFVGMLLITVGVFRLDEIEVHDRYATAMRFVKVVAVLATIDAVRLHFVFSTPQAVSLALHFFGLFKLAATILFCIAMRWLCQVADLREAGESWKVTTLLFVVIYAIPLGLLHIATCLAVLTGDSFHIDLGPLGLILLVVFAVPLVHLFISTSRMKKGAEHL